MGKSQDVGLSLYFFLILGLHLCPDLVVGFFFGLGLGLGLGLILGLNLDLDLGMNLGRLFGFINSRLTISRF